MTNRGDQEPDGVLVLIAQIAALLLVFAVPVVVCLLVFPDSTTLVMLVAAYLVFGIASLFAGIGWQEPTYSNQAKTYTKVLILLTVFAVVLSRWQAVPDHSAGWVLDVTGRVAVLVLPFFVGRFVKNQIHRVSKPH